MSRIEANRLDDAIESFVEEYRRGLFPMADPESGDMHWYAPDPRALIPIELPPTHEAAARGRAMHLPKSLVRALRRAPFHVTADTAFDQVIDGCAALRPGRESTWIDHRIRGLFVAMHQRGLAHSVEVWTRDGGDTGGGGRLVGGVYGLHVGAAFFAESMFSRPEDGGTNASKIALAHLVRHLHSRGVRLLDVQFTNPHLIQFGIVEVRRREYLSRLKEVLDRPVKWGDFASFSAW